MSRIFRRPMFRKGGNVGEGIMTGIVDREEYAEAGPAMAAGQRGMGANIDFGLTNNAEERRPFYQQRTIPSLRNLTTESLQALQEAAGPRGGFDPLTSFLLAYGPAAAMENRGGGTVANLIAAAKEPAAALIKGKADEDKFQRGLRTEATGASIAQRNQMIAAEADRKFRADLEEAKAILNRDLTREEMTALEERVKSDQEAAMARLEKDIKGRKDIAQIKEDNKKVERSPEYLTQLETNMKDFDGLPGVAKRATDFQFEKQDDLKAKVGQGRVKGSGVLTFNINDPAEAKANKNIIKDLAGTFVYDPYENNYKKIIFEDGQIGQPIPYATIESIQLDGVSGTGSDTKVVEKPKSGLFGQKTKPPKTLKQILPDFTDPSDLNI
jgi:hypothetical protein